MNVPSFNASSRLAELHRFEKRAHPDNGRSWMAPGAETQDLLYISDEGTNDVYVYSWPQLKLVGTLTGFSYPQGECIDTKGDVFVVNIRAQSQIVEYSHGGTKPIATLSDNYSNHPSGCAVDPTTENLAVTNLEAGNKGDGTVIIYKKARGRPTGYTDPHNINYFYYCGYDEKGNLYVDGSFYIYPFDIFGFAELPAGGAEFTNITLNQSIGEAGGVQWDGRYVVIGDASASVLYEFAISGSGGTEVGSTTLDGGFFVWQFWIQGGKVIGPSEGTADVMIWNYPAGGAAVKTLTNVTDPVGAVISLRK